MMWTTEPTTSRAYAAFIAANLLGSSFARATAPCVYSSKLGRGPPQQEFTLKEPTKLSISGYKTSVNYVTEPGVSSRALKIKSASEGAIVDFEDGVMNIAPARCKEGEAETSWAPAPRSATSLVTPVMVMMASLGGIVSTPLAAIAGLAMLLPGAYGDDDGQCQPVLEIDISVPFECPYNNFAEGGRCLSPRQIADQAVQALFIDFNVTAAEALLATDYIQHNPAFPTGAAPVLGAIPLLQADGLGLEVHRTLEAGNLVAYHSTYTNANLFGGETLVGFDVFRVEDGKLQEHWDNLQPIAGPNPSGNTMVDGPTMVKYLQKTDTNKALALEIVNTVLKEGNVSAVPFLISSTEYTQHNPDIADGLDGLQAGLAALAEQGLMFVYNSVELVVAQGNFVLLGSAGEFGGNATAYYDLFRVEDGFVVEHWDVIQPIPAAEDFAHDNGKF